MKPIRVKTKKEAIERLEKEFEEIEHKYGDILPLGEKPRGDTSKCEK